MSNLLFFCSGFVGLVYEITWQKRLFLILGSNAEGIVSVLVSFFFGIAIGGRLGDSILQKIKPHPMKLYGVAESVIVFCALSSPFLFSAVDHLSVQFPAFFQIPFTKFLITSLFTMPATICMGISIPAIVHSISSPANMRISKGYGINTLGAMVGALSAGFFLLPTFGIRVSELIAAGIGALVAAFAFLQSKNASIQIDDQKSTPGTTLLYFFSGMLALGAETLWSRMIALHATNSLYAFTWLLFFFLLGSGTGSMFVFPILLRRLQNHRMVFMLSTFCASIALLLSIPLFYKMSHIQGFLFSESIFSYHLMNAVLCAIPVFIPSLFFGIAFPALGAETGSNSGKLYFYGNVGAAFGTILVGFLMIPSLGLVKSLTTLSLIAAFLAAFSNRTLLFTKLKSAPLAVIITLYLVCFIYFFSSPRPFLKNSESELLRYQEGLVSTVAVRNTPISTSRNVTRIYVDEQLVASTDPDAVVDSKMLAHLPLLMHPQPKSALTVGFGSGGTSYSMSLYEIKATAVEIEKEIYRSARFFPYAGVLSRKNFMPVLDDARNHLRTSGVTYDVISTDVTNLQYKQNPYLYTREYFELMKSKLNPGGIACAWIPMASIDPADFKTLIRTFMTVYQNTTLWYFNTMPTFFAILTGTDSAPDLKEIQSNPYRNHELVKRDLGSIGIHDQTNFSPFILLNQNDLKNYVGDGPLHTDNHPILESSNPHATFRYLQTFAVNLSEALKINQSPDPFGKHVNQSILHRTYGMLERDMRKKSEFYEAALQEALLAKQSNPQFNVEVWHETPMRQATEQLKKFK